MSSWFGTSFLVALLFEYISAAANSSETLPRIPRDAPEITKPATTKSTTSQKESAPAFAYAAWDENGKLCVLAKFEATFVISFSTKTGKSQINEKIPQDAVSKGVCGSLLDNPTIDVSWRGGFTFRIVFEKNIDANSWGIEKMDLVYNTGDSLFYGSVTRKSIKAETKKNSLKQFETPMGKSYLCPATPAVSLYTKTGEQTVIVRITNAQMQAFEIKNGKFSPVQRCPEVAFGSGVQTPFYITGYQQDESVPLIVGTISVIASLSTIAGYAIYRSWFFKRVEYDQWQG